MSSAAGLRRHGQISKALHDEGKDRAVKPGQLLTCIGAMHDELASTDTRRADPDKVERLQAIQQETLHALNDIVDKGRG